MPACPAIRRLVLTDFRSWPKLDIAVQPGLVVLTGENGAGKTNILEAISLLSQGRGLRRSDVAECARQDGPGGWAVSAQVSGGDYPVQLGTGIDPPQSSAKEPRRYKVDRASVPSARSFAGHIRVVWLSPSMDGLFTASPGERRRFLDRMVLALDADHGTRVSALERALRNRNRLLEERMPDRSWLDAAEREVAELGVAVAAARLEALARLTALIVERQDASSPFPWAELAIAGEIEAMLAIHPALEVEDLYRRMLRDNRNRDAAAGRTLSGPHTSDLKVRHGAKQAGAEQCSTGEQKALLTGLVLAHAHLVATVSGMAPVLLLDEVAAHFDIMRRERLFADLAALGSQVWMTGADAAAFSSLAGRADMLRVGEGQVTELQEMMPVKFRA